MSKLLAGDCGLRGGTLELEYVEQGPAGMI